jgi:hypothetical protein
VDCVKKISLQNPPSINLGENMRKILMSLVLVSATLLIGCEEDNLEYSDSQLNVGRGEEVVLTPALAKKLNVARGMK